MYVPLSTTTVLPGTTTFAAAWMVAKGAAAVPGFASLPFGLT